MNLTIAHVGLPTPHHNDARQKGTTVEINLATTRTVLLALSAPGGPHGIRPMTDFFGWPQWQAPSIPPATRTWNAIFSTNTKTLQGLFRRAESRPGQEPLAIHLPTPMPLTDPLWQMLQTTSCVVLCTGLAGDPTAAGLGMAAREGKLQAVLVQALLD